MATTRPVAEWNDVVAHLKGGFQAVAVLAAMQLDLFTPLADGPRTANELAAALGVPVDRLRLLLRSLAATGVVAVEGERYGNSVGANASLVKGRPGYMGGAHELYAHFFTTILNTAESVRTGRPQAHHDWETMDEEELRATFRGLNATAAAQGRALAQRHDFGRFKSLVDVGGGGGGFSMGVCDACPGLSAQVVDLPRVARIWRGSRRRGRPGGTHPRARSRHRGRSAPGIP